MSEVRTRGRGKVASVVVGLALVAGVFHLASSASASFPGTNGLIAYLSAGNVFVVDPANPVPTQVTNTGNFGSGVSFNATANKLASSTNAGLVLLDPVAGSAVTPIPNTVAGDTLPSFDPDGKEVVFNAGNTIVRIRIEGTNRTTVFTSPNPGGNALQPDWSADGKFIAFALDVPLVTNSIQRMNPNGGNVTTLATAGPAGPCGAANPCTTASVAPDNAKVAYAQLNGGTAGLAQVNADGSTVTPVRLTTGAGDVVPAYSPDGTQLVFSRAGTLSRVPSDGSGTVTAVGTIGGVQDTSWGIKAGTGTGTGTGGSVISVTAARTGANCVFSIVATPAKAGVTVDFSITNKKGVVKLTGNDVTVPASPSIKARKRGRNKVRIITLSDPKGATLGTPSATCAK